MVNNLPSSYAKTVVYPAYRELLDSASRGKKWTWCEVCPDAIVSLVGATKHELMLTSVKVGFTPNGSQFSLALHWAQYLSLYAYNHGIGPHAQESGDKLVEVAFPGSAAGADSLFSPVSSKTIARFMIDASHNPETCGGGRLFNIADNETPSTYGDLWVHLAKWFGLVGVGPVENLQNEAALKVGELPESSPSMAPGEYIGQHRDIFAKLGCMNAASGGVGAGSRQLDSVGYWLTFDRQLSLSKLKETGLQRSEDPVEGWLESFGKFRQAGLIL